MLKFRTVCGVNIARERFSSNSWSGVYLTVLYIEPNPSLLFWFLSLLVAIIVQFLRVYCFYSVRDDTMIFHGHPCTGSLSSLFCNFNYVTFYILQVLQPIFVDWPDEFGFLHTAPSLLFKFLFADFAENLNSTFHIGHWLVTYWFEQPNQRLFPPCPIICFTVQKLIRGSRHHCTNTLSPRSVSRRFEAQYWLRFPDLCLFWLCLAHDANLLVMNIISYFKYAQ